MLLTFFLILSLAYTLILKNELGSLYLTSGESHRLPLSDYFEGNNLSFSITNSNMTQSSSKIHFTQELQLLAFAPYQDPDWNKTWSKSNQKHVFISGEYGSNLLVSYNENYLFVYEILSQTAEVNLLWAGIVETPYKNSQIMGVRYRERRYSDLIIWVVGEDISNNAFALRNDIYILSTTGLTDSSQPVWANFSGITYATEIVLADGYIQDHLCISFKFEGDPIALYIYDLKNIYKPVLYQKIFQYDKISTPELGILSIFIAENTLCILDKGYGLIIYRYDWQALSFFESEAYDLRLFGSLYSMQPLCEKMLSVTAESGAIIIRYSISISFKILGIINEDKHYRMQSLYIQSSRHYYFLQSSSGILSIIPKGKDNFDALCSFDLEKIIGKGFESNGIFEVFSNVINGNDYYARFDRDGLRFYQLNIEEWSLEVSEITNCFIEITAADHNGVKVSSILSIISIPSSSQEILPLDHYRKSAIYPATSFVNNFTSFMFAANSFFSGPNLSFRMEISHSEHFSFDFVPPIQPYLALNLSVADNAIKAFIYGCELVIFYPDKVTTDINDYVHSWTLNIPNPVAYLTYRDRFHIIYSEPSENSYIISFFHIDYFEPQTLLQVIESSFECNFFELREPYLLCSNTTQLDIYGHFNDTWSLRFSFIGESLNEGFSWNLLDVKFAKNQFGSSLYLLDEAKGVLMISLDKLGKLNSSYFYENSIEENEGLVKIAASENYVSFINENGWIDIYDYPLTFRRRIFLGIPSGLISNVAADSNMVYIQLDNSTYVYDLDQPSHNSLFYIFKFSLPTIISYGSYSPYRSCLGTFFSSENGKYLELYSIPCPTDRNYINNEMCGLDFQVSCFISKKEKLWQSFYHANITITAYNENSSLAQNLPLILIASEPSIKFYSSEWKINENIPFNERLEISLDGVFLGQDLTMELNINDVWMENTTEVKAPAFLLKRSKQVGLHQFKTHLYNHIDIPNNLVVITSESGFIVANSTGFSDNPLYINITEVTKLKQLICTMIDWFPYPKNNQTLFATSCIYKIYQTSSNINQPLGNRLLITAESLILWEFDYTNLSITNFKMINITAMPSFLRLAPLDEDNFEIMIFSMIESKEIIYDNNEIFRYRGSWQKSHIEIHQAEIINWFTLNLPSFYVKVLDFEVKSSETVYWYALEEHYGVRIIKTSNCNSSLIVGGLPRERDSTFAALGRCGDSLLILSSSLGIESYKIKDDADLKLEFYYYVSSYDYYSSSAGRIIACSDDFRYIATPIFEAWGEISIGIWDRNAKNATNRVANAYVSKCFNILSAKGVKFANKNTLSSLGCEEKLYTSYRINDNSLIFPDFSEDEYIDIVEGWGTRDFRLFITAKNKKDEQISSIVYFSRETPEGYKDCWWIWVLLSVCILIVFTVAIFSAVKVLKARKNKPMKSFLMQELRCEEQ